MPTNSGPPKASARAWLIWSLSALAFGYAFFQRVAPSVMVPELMAEFSIGAAVTGYLSALYFYPYVALQFPLGALLDRFGVRSLLTSAIGLAAIGSLLFAMAQSIEQAYLGRALVGIGSAVGFLSALTLAAKWFPPSMFAFLAGLVMLFGTISGVAGQAPLAALIAQWCGSMLCRRDRAIRQHAQNRCRSSEHRRVPAFLQKQSGQRFLSYGDSLRDENGYAPTARPSQRD